MWLHGGLQAAADTPAPVVSDQLIVIVGGVISAAIVALGGVLVAIVNSRSNKTTSSPPAPTPPSGDAVLYERTAVHNRRLDDNDRRFDVMDRARAHDREDLDDVLGFLDRNEPDWRTR